jgi:hypothetical protein
MSSANMPQVSTKVNTLIWSPTLLMGVNLLSINPSGACSLGMEKEELTTSELQRSK